MRILFFDIGETDHKGVEILSALLKQQGHTVDLLLDPALGKHYYLKIPLLNRLIPDTLLLKKAVAFAPDLVAMSIVTNHFMYFAEFGKKLKQVLPHVPIIVGGIHPTSVPEEVIQETWVDMLCIGDGEEAFSELVSAMGTGKTYNTIANLWVKDEQGIVHRNPLRPLVGNIDQYPAPDRSIYAQYGVLGKRIRCMTARGCVHRCTFCVNSFRCSLYEGEKYLRKHSVSRVIEELLEVKRLYKPRAIRFEDDVFVLDREWLVAFSKEYKEKIALPFHCYFTPSGVKQEIIEILKNCGCHSIAMGIQSGNEELRQKIMNRNYSNRKVIEAAAIIRNAGIKLYAEYMFGLPEETPENMWETLRVSEQIDASNTWASIFYPYPKTQLTEYCLQHGYIDNTVYQNIVKGIGGPQSYSVLKHPYAEDAFKFKVILPLYASSPKFIRPWLKALLKRKTGCIHKLLYVLGIPLLEKREFFYRLIRLPSIIIKTRRILKKL